MNQERRDTINEALSDAICDGEGRGDADHLVHHLAKRGLVITQPDNGLVVHANSDGTRLEFKASNGMSAALRIESIADEKGGGVISQALRQWCADRHEDADVSDDGPFKALQDIAGGHIPDASTLAVNGQWQEIATRLQGIARAALTRAGQ